VAEPDAGQRLDLDVADRGALVLREVADLRLRELDVFEGRRFHPGQDRVEVGLRQLLRRPPVELLGVLAHRGVAALLHVGEDAFDGLAHLLVDLVGELAGDAAFEVGGHENLR
jgi:hypothetical protein